MKVFIAGATGVLGRRLIRQLTVRGHSVVGQVRSARSESIVQALGGNPRHADLFDAESLAKAAAGCDTVIHAATAIPTKSKTNPADWAMNDHIRRKGTRCLTEAAAKIGAKAYLQQSIEGIAREAGAVDGFTVAILRGGLFYDYESAHTRMLADGLRKRQMPIIGTGEAVWALIHTDDAASAFVAIAEQPKSGVWHIVDNELVTVRAFLGEFASRLGAPPPRRTPTWLARWIAGEQAVAYFTRSTRTTNARLRHDFGWTPHYATYREGLDQIVAALKTESAGNAAAQAAGG